MLGVEGTGCLPEGKRRTGIEPASSPWKGEALPLSYHPAWQPSPVRSSPTMTVCTSYVALCNLVERGLSAAATAAGPGGEWIGWRERMFAGFSDGTRGGAGGRALDGACP